MERPCPTGTRGKGVCFAVRNSFTGAIKQNTAEDRVSFTTRLGVLHVLEKGFVIKLWAHKNLK